MTTASSFTLKVFIKAVLIVLPFFVFAKNTPPKVDAGPVRRIVYPTDTALLCGKGSDVDGPVTFKWTQMRGNSIAKIAQPTNDTTVVSGLKPGSYTFILTVRDGNGTTRTDSTNVTVLQKMTWVINGITREAMVHLPTGGSGQPPVIFAFHGHGGTDFGFAEKGFEFFWPEAIVVYPQGLITKTPVDSNCKLAGWQTTVGEINCRNGAVDQDVKFFNAMLNRMIKKYNANPSLVFVHGWSNGADFAYDVLWAKLRNKIAAICPAGATLDTIVGKRPMPVMHVAGKLDVHVPFDEQQQTVQEVRTLDKCSSDSSVWATGTGGLLATEYSSRINDKVVFLQYDGDHGYPYTVPPLIARYFKEVAADILATTTTPLITRVYPINKSLPAKSLY